MYCSYCRVYEEGQMKNADGELNTGHELCSKCYTRWKGSEMRNKCPMCKYDTILFFRKNYEKEEGIRWMEKQVGSFKKQYGL